MGGEVQWEASEGVLEEQSERRSDMEEPSRRVRGGHCWCRWWWWWWWSNEEEVHHHHYHGEEEEEEPNRQQQHLQPTRRPLSGHLSPSGGLADTHGPGPVRDRHRHPYSRARCCCRRGDSSKQCCGTEHKRYSLSPSQSTEHPCRRQCCCCWQAVGREVPREDPSTLLEEHFYRTSVSG